MKTVTKTSSKVLLMVAAVLLALIVGTIVSIMINLLLLAIIKPDGRTLAVATCCIASLISAVITYVIAYLLIKKCGLGKIKWLNILCATLTLLWCLVWGFGCFIDWEDSYLHPEHVSLYEITYNDDYDDSYYEDADDGYYEEISEDM